MNRRNFLGVAIVGAGLSIGLRDMAAAMNRAQRPQIALVTPPKPPGYGDGELVPAWSDEMLTITEMKREPLVHYIECTSAAACTFHIERTSKANRSRFSHGWLKDH